MTELHNNKSIKRFQEIVHFDVEEQDTVLKILDAMIMNNRMARVMSMDANYPDPPSRHRLLRCLRSFLPADYG